MIYAVMACDQTGGIGKDNKLPWPTLKRDMAHFKHITKGKSVVMGRKTWDSLPESVRPLPDRKNIVIASDPLPYDHGCDLGGFLNRVEDADGEDFYIIGGASIYQQLEHLIDYWYLTIIEGNYDCDTHFKPNLSNFEFVGEITVVDEGKRISFKEYRRKK